METGIERARKAVDALNAAEKEFRVLFSYDSGLCVTVECERYNIIYDHFQQKKWRLEVDGGPIEDIGDDD